VQLVSILETLIEIELILRLFGSTLLRGDKNNEMNKEIIFAVRYLSGNIGLGSPFGNLFAPINNGANVIVGTANWFNSPSDNLINAYIMEGDETR
jgi:starch-binding outer membrane protein, SusD/RagB family